MNRLSKYCLMYHSAMIIDRLFDASCTEQYLGYDMDGRVKLVEAVIEDYIEYFEICREDYDDMKGDIFPFLVALFNEYKVGAIQ